MYETEKIPVTWVVTRRKLLEDICLLGQAVAFFKYACLRRSKADLSWAQGLLRLALLLHFQGGCPHSWRNASEVSRQEVAARCGKASLHVLAVSYHVVERSHVGA